MSYYVGIDLHSDNNYTGVIDKRDSRIFGKKLPNDLDVIVKELEPFKKEIKGIIPGTPYLILGIFTFLLRVKKGRILNLK